jgi:hypothetical protein
MMGAATFLLPAIREINRECREFYGLEALERGG